MARLSPTVRLAAVAAVWLAFGAATERWMRWGEPIRRQYATDELQYQTIARAAPGLPQTEVSAAAAQRFTTHWLVGSVADLTGVGLHTVYRVAGVLCVIALAAVLIRLCRAFALPEWASAVALGLVLTNPYTLRLLLIAPAMLSDAVLVLGAALALLGLVEERWRLAIAGGVVAALGREMGLAVALAVCVWLIARRRPFVGALALAVPGAAFTTAKLVAESFSLANPSLGGFTIVSPLLRLPGTARLLAEHFGRVAIAAPLALALLLASLLVLFLRRELNFEASPLWAAVLVWALLFAEPVFFNPDWVLRNETRLAALAIVPLALAAASALARACVMPTRAAVVAIVGAVAVASLHHRYTWNPLPGWIYVAVETLIAASLAAYVLVSSRAAPSPAQAASPTR